MTMPGMCAACGHATTLHTSAGCLWSLTALSCQCSLERAEAH